MRFGLRQSIQLTSNTESVHGTPIPPTELALAPTGEGASVLPATPSINGFFGLKLPSDSFGEPVRFVPEASAQKTLECWGAAALASGRKWKCWRGTTPRPTLRISHGSCGSPPALRAIT